MDLALVEGDQAQFAGGVTAFSQPGQHVLRRGHRFLILPMGQVMPRTTMAVAQPLHRAVNGGGADPHAHTVGQHLAQVADAPDRDRQTVRLWAGFQRLAQKRQGRRIEFGGRPRPRLVRQAVRPLAKKRERHARTRCGAVANRRATADMECPSLSKSRA